MTNADKKTLTLITFWPYIYLPLYLVYILLFHINTLINVLLSIVAVLSVISLTFIYVIYLVNVFINEDVEGDSLKISWFLIIFFFSAVAIPIYWYIYIRSKSSKGDVL